MRFLTRKHLWRAFPELDDYPDEQCSRFVSAAGQSATHGFALVAYVMSVLVLSCPTLAFINIAVDRIEHSSRIRVIDWPWAPLTCLAFIPLLALPILTGLVLRDQLLRRRVIYLLRHEARCPNCRYSLIGLTLSFDSYVTCPECGHHSQVDPALAILTINDAGQVQLSPGVRLPDPPASPHN